MKKLLLITCFLAFLSCSKNDDASTMITADEYGVVIKAPNESYSYKFYTEPTGAIIQQGERTGDQNLFFPVGEKEITAEHLHFELELENDSTDEIEVFLISRKGDLYMNYEDNPDAKSVFEMNNTRKKDGVILGDIPMKRDQVFWVRNSEWSHND